MVRGENLWDQISRKWELEGELLPGQSLVEILGRSRVLIEGHRGVVEYCRERITVRLSFGWVCVRGCGLQLRCMSHQQLVICGQIGGIDLKGREGA